MSKKQKCPEFENHERWLVSYADMLTLLFAVFVVLFALKEGGEPQVQRAAGSMQESFNTPLEDIPMDERIGPIEQGFGIFEHFKGERMRPPIMQKYPDIKERPKIIDSELEKVKVNLEERLYGPNKFSGSNKPGEERIVSVQRTEKGFVLRMLARHFYKPGEVKVRKEAKADLDGIINILKDLGRNVRIEGHTDSIPADKEYSNWEISALRATYVVSYMIGEHNFPQSLISAAGFADTRPIASNGTESGRNLNRRIEIHVDYE